MLAKINPQTTKSWKKLIQLAQNHDRDIKKLFKKDPERITKYLFEWDDFLFDFSKNDISDTIIQTLLELSKDCQVSQSIQKQFDGEKINETENRAVLHTQLRNENTHTPRDKNIHNELNKIKHFSESLNSGQWKGYTGKSITNIVNIGIGGSDLGPKMVTHALRPYWKNITPHFISNVDASQLIETLENLNTENTVFIIASKTFTTQETMTNAHTAKTWFLQNGGNEESICKHFVAVSTNEKEVKKFGVHTQNMFIFWDWVGGRYSLWSAIGLSIACTIGYENFIQLLKGAQKMDQHFKNTPIEKNIPIISALVGIWYNNFLNYSSLAILPYDHRLRFLPSYLQQADMESNGKNIDRDGQPIDYQSGSIIWGKAGTNGQHAFYQLIHQGTKIIPCEFIAFAKPHHNHPDHHQKLLANFFAQSEALLQGKSKVEVQQELKQSNESLIPYKVFTGNRPSTSILIKELTPNNLGKLIAFYEHRIFVQGIIWNIYSYDQWGVELGKQLAKPILEELQSHNKKSHDASTSQLIKHYQKLIK